MTDIWGNPEPQRVYVPVYPSAGGSRDDMPMPGLDHQAMPAMIVILYALAAGLYVMGLVSAFPRTFWHDALMAAGLIPSFAAAACWPSVRNIPYVGGIVYFLPGLALACAPFALDVYLMFGR